MRFKIDFTDDISLVYDLVEENIVKDWADILKTRKVEDICPHNHYIGYVSDEVLQNKIERLYELADYINFHTPDRVIKTPITRENYQHAMNVMHVHFPLLKNNEEYKDIWPMLTEYNDIIHWLESTIPSRWGNNNLSESRLFRITLDFNKSNVEFRPIPDDAYKLFDPNTLFGELKIHYTHVGRHAQELYITNDMACPIDQFIPQRLYTASVRMHFTENYYINMNHWEQFYNARGKEFWGMDIDDPKLAFGYMKIGQLSNIIMNGIVSDIPSDTNSRHEFRKKLVKTKVLNWEII